MECDKNIELVNIRTPTETPKNDGIFLGYHEKPINFCCGCLQPRRFSLNKKTVFFQFAQSEKYVLMLTNQKKFANEPRGMDYESIFAIKQKKIA